MSRVWKHFLKNLAWPFGFATYLFAVIAGANYANTFFIGAGVVVVVLFIVLPVLGWLVLDMWRDAKEKVERENKEMMRTLKGSDYK